MTFISILIIAISAFIGGFNESMEASNAQAPTQVTQAPSQAYTQAPAPSDWVCATGSTTECTDVLKADATQTLSDKGVSTDPAIADRVALQYLGTSDRMTQPHSYMEFSLESIDFPGTFHHFAYVSFARA